MNPPSAGARMGTPAGRWVLLATISGSGMAMLDATVVNIALPSIAGDLGTDFRTLQWIVNAYTLTLAALILLAGALGDHFGRRRIFLLGVVWFAVASLLCGLAPTAEFLVAARALQGIGGALLTPGSLAIISSTFVASDRAKAVGAWSGLGGMAAAIGPFVGGWLVTLDPRHRAELGGPTLCRDGVGGEQRHRQVRRSAGRCGHSGGSGSAWHRLHRSAVLQPRICHRDADQRSAARAGCTDGSGVAARAPPCPHSGRTGTAPAGTVHTLRSGRSPATPS